jgi:hypothetical protein
MRPRAFDRADQLRTPRPSQRGPDRADRPTHASPLATQLFSIVTQSFYYIH